jgi:hypothetical protein
MINNPLRMLFQPNDTTMLQVTFKHEYTFKKTTSNKLSEAYKILLPPQKYSTSICREPKNKKEEVTCKK